MASLNVPINLPESFADEIAEIITKKVMETVDANIRSNDLPPYPTRKQVRDVLRIGDDRLTDWISEGLPIIPFGKETRFDRDDIKLFLNKKKI
ncbi:MAG: DNA-binding protein [Enterococcus lemanii]